MTPFDAGVVSAFEKQAIFGLLKGVRPPAPKPPKMPQTARQQLGLGTKVKGRQKTTRALNPRRHEVGQPWVTETKKMQPLEIPGLTDQPNIQWGR